MGRVYKRIAQRVGRIHFRIASEGQGECFYENTQKADIGLFRNSNCL